MDMQGRRFGLKNVSSNRLNVALYPKELRPMVFSRRAVVVLAVAVFALFALSTAASFAASSVMTKISVPSTMIKGSAVTSGRAFYRTSLPEDSLGGIKLGRKAVEILTKWGNPSRITVGTTHAQVTDVSNPTQPGVPYVAPAPNSNNNPYAALAESLSNAINSGTGSAGKPALPSLPELGAPSSNLPSVGQPGPSGHTQTLTQEEVTWTYDLPNGITLEFIITEGIITQITVGGVGPWGDSRTRTGLQLGDTYKLALYVSGYPESQNYVGRFLRVSYVNRNRALFTFLKNKLVGITIAMVPEELK